MNYIINPMWFYWLQITNNIKIFAFVCSLTITITTVVCVIIWGVAKSMYNDFPNISDGERKTYLGLEKMFRPAVISLIISWVVFIVIPSKETLITMMVAKFATYDNAQLTVDAIKSAVDYIIQAIQQIG